MENIGSVITSIFRSLGGNNGWMLWLAGGITFWVAWFKANKEIYLYGAIFCSLIIVLIIIEQLRNAYKRNRLRARQIQERARINTSQDAYYRNVIWKFFATVDEEYLKGAAQLLEFMIIEGNECSRFISRDKQNDQELWLCVLSIVSHMKIPRELGDNWELIRIEQLQDGCFLHFEPYFFDLLKHYKSTRKRELV